jgi:hypothetical protein
MRTATLSLSFAFALLLAACGDDGPPAVQVGPVSYSASELLGLSDARRSALGDLVAFGLAVADSTTDALGAPLRRRMEDDRLLDALAAELTLEGNGVSDEVLEAHYLTDPDYELTVRHILFFSERWRTEEHRAQAREKAERALQALREGEDFARTAARLSEEPGAEGRQGLLTPGREGAWVSEFWAAASALEVGEISPVTETQYGYHILRLEGRTVVPLGEARSRVARDVANRIEDPAAVLEAFLDEQPEIFVAEDVIGASTYDSFTATALLASWEGGHVDFADYLTWAAAQPASWNRGGLGSDEDAFRATIMELARRRQGLDAAEARGLAPSVAEVAAVAQAWNDDVLRWSTALGFVTGQTAEQVGEAALAALARTGQSADITRTELSQRSPLIRARYDVSVAASGG